MRRYLVVGNWKMNLTTGPARELAAEIAAHMRQSDHHSVGVVVCPPFTALLPVRDVISDSGVALGAQDCHTAVSGAYTGDISAHMIVDAGCRYVIVGHSERRQYHAESDGTVAAKAIAALASDLVPIVCVGETQQQYENDRSEEVIRGQIRSFLEGTGPASAGRCVFAYEPVWAIGTGLAATPDHAQRIHAFIRGLLLSAGCLDMTILYGGSVTAENATALFSCADVDGALVGGASLVASSFCSVIDQCARVAA